MLLMYLTRIDRSIHFLTITDDVWLNQHNFTDIANVVNATLVTNSCPNLVTNFLKTL